MSRAIPQPPRPTSSQAFGVLSDSEMTSSHAKMPKIAPQISQTMKMRPRFLAATAVITAKNSQMMKNRRMVRSFSSREVRHDL